MNRIDPRGSRWRKSAADPVKIHSLGRQIDSRKVAVSDLTRLPGVGTDDPVKDRSGRRRALLAMRQYFVRIAPSRWVDCENLCWSYTNAIELALSTELRLEIELARLAEPRLVTDLVPPIEHHPVTDSFNRVSPSHRTLSSVEPPLSAGLPRGAGWS
jgi:hypothetical protein